MSLKSFYTGYTVEMLNGIFAGEFDVGLIQPLKLIIKCPTTVFFFLLLISIPK